MAKINISNLTPSSAELSQDSEKSFRDITEEETGKIVGGLAAESACCCCCCCK